ncbi:MAG: hypothetical protein GY937_22890 [bacterium]|nr:hypothetical protein [bacterium]
MARLTISAGTTAYNYPDGFDIVRENTITRTESQNIAGRMGSYIRSHGNPIGEKSLTVFGRLIGADASDLDTKTYEFMRVHTFGTGMQLTDNTLSRHAIAWLAGIQYTDRRHAFIREVTIRFVLPGGVWGVDDAFVPAVTTAGITSTQLVRYAHPLYGGSAPGPAQLVLTPGAGTWPASGDGEVIWRGRNLIVNSSLEEGVGAKPDDWDTIGGGSNPDVVEWFGRSGQRCVKISKPGGTNYALSQDVNCDASTEYTYSVYAALPSGATGNLTLLIQSRDSGGGFLSNTTQNFAVTESSWTRFEVTHTTDASAALLRCIFRCVSTGEEVYVDDVQLERAGTVGEFIDTSLPRYKHITFKLESPGQLAFATTDSLSIDCVRARTRLLRSGSWQENNDEVNGHYFELVPGLNHIEFTEPSSGTLAVEIRHRDLFL